jgi:predicted nucleic acid-binding protein
LKVVCDTSALIGLAKIGKLGLLRKLYSCIYIPWSVCEELAAMNGEIDIEDKIEGAEWVKKMTVNGGPIMHSLVSEIGQSAVDVLTLSKVLEADLMIVDDSRTTAAAVSAGFQTAGLPGLLLLANQRNLLQETD